MKGCAFHGASSPSFVRVEALSSLHLLYFYFTTWLRGLQLERGYAVFKGDGSSSEQI